MRKTLLALAVVATVAAALPAAAQDGTLEVRITNLTYGQILSPPVVAAHATSTRMFLPGRSASPGLTLLAEDGDGSELMAELAADPEVRDAVAAGGPILPGRTVTLELTAAAADRLSLATMLVTTNDAFVGVDSFDLGSFAGRAELFGTAYDAGTEANTEDCAHVPGPPCGNALVRVTRGAERFIHVHRGIQGGADLTPASHDWRNPVARIVIIRR